MKHSYDVSTLQAAVTEILEGKKSMRKASKDHKIPYASLHKVIRTGKLEINKPGHRYFPCNIQMVRPKSAGGQN